MVAVALTVGIVGSAEAGPTYAPVGVQQNVPVATVLGGGWSVCYTATYATPLGNDATSALAGCHGPDIMLAGMVTGSSIYGVLAEAPLADVTFNTGAADNGVTHMANGSEWYYAPGWSWGFAGAGDAVFKTECDINGGSDRLCWHTIPGVGGYRDGNNVGLNFSVDFTKVILTDSADPVPEPATLTLLGVGLAALGVVRRRRLAVRRRA